MKKALIFISGIVMVFVLSGCATVFSGSQDKISVYSEPEGAEVKVDGVAVANTPAVLSLSKKTSHMITISAESYRPEYFTVENSLGAGWLVLDVLTGVVPVIADAATGNWNHLSPDTISVRLIPEE